MFRPIHSARVVIVVFLTVAMLLAHWMGLTHRIEHARQAPFAAATQPAHASHPSQQKGVQHACLAYDAATVAPALHTPGCAIIVLPAEHVSAHWVAADSWNAPASRYFSPRAPPAA
jgi:hypothetical protein